MKLHKLASLFMLLTAASPVFAASQYCPSDISLSFGKYTAPSGWQITRESIDMNDPNITKSRDYKFEFVAALYDYARDGKGSSNGQMITCIYGNPARDQPVLSVIDITTDPSVYAPLPEPSYQGTKWVKFKKPGDTGILINCGFSNAFELVTADQCPWN